MSLLQNSRPVQWRPRGCATAQVSHSDRRKTLDATRHARDPPRESNPRPASLSSVAGRYVRPVQWRLRGCATARRLSPLCLSHSLSHSLISLSHTRTITHAHTHRLLSLSLNSLSRITLTLSPTSHRSTGRPGQWRLRGCATARPFSPIAPRSRPRPSQPSPARNFKGTSKGCQWYIEVSMGTCRRSGELGFQLHEFGVSMARARQNGKSTFIYSVISNQ